MNYYKSANDVLSKNYLCMADLVNIFNYSFNLQQNSHRVPMIKLCYMKQWLIFND